MTSQKGWYLPKIKKSISQSFCSADCGDNCGVCYGNKTSGCERCAPGYYLKSNNTCAGKLWCQIFSVSCEIMLHFKDKHLFLILKLFYLHFEH